MKKLKEYLTSKDLLSVLELTSNINSRFKDISSYYNGLHDQYFHWLEERIASLISTSKIQDMIKNSGIDWLTLHYNSRHPYDEWSEYINWFNYGMGFSEFTIKNQNKLKVYKADVSPFISYFSESIVDRASPLKILFSDKNQDTEKGWLVVSNTLSEFLKKITNGPNSQPDFTTNELNECLRIDESCTLEIKKIMSNFSGEDLRPEKALGLFRNTTRVSLLILKEKAIEKNIGYPRIAILCPIYLAENIMGGIAYVGNKFLNDSHIYLFHILAYNLISGIRLVEEPLREAQSRIQEELNKVKIDFIHSLSHSMQDPLEILSDKISTSVNELHTVQNEINKLRKNSSDLLIKFGSENIDDFLELNISEVNLKDYFSLIHFQFINTINKKGLKLLINDIPSSWKASFDRDKIWEVLTNLFTNSIRYAKTFIQIIVEKDDTESIYKFRFIDDGKGIDDKIRSQLFKPGINKIIKDSREGMHGLGLYLSKKRIDMHNGEIYLNEKEKEKTEIIIELPFNINNSS